VWWKGKKVSGSSDGFNIEHYVKEMTLKILKQNRGVKLNAKTLTKLADKGLRLIPPLDP
jgi:hypothetical protein